MPLLSVFDAYYCFDAVRSTVSGRHRSLRAVDSELRYWKRVMAREGTGWFMAVQQGPARFLEHVKVSIPGTPLSSGLPNGRHAARRQWTVPLLFRHSPNPRSLSRSLPSVVRVSSCLRPSPLLGVLSMSPFLSPPLPPLLSVPLADDIPPPRHGRPPQAHLRPRRDRAPRRVPPVPPLGPRHGAV